MLKIGRLKLKHFSQVKICNKCDITKIESDIQKLILHTAREEKIEENRV